MAAGTKLPPETSSLSADCGVMFRGRQRLMGTKNRRPEVGLGDAGTNTQQVLGSPSIGLPLLKPSMRMRPLSSGTSTTCAKIPSWLPVVSAICFQAW